MSLGYGAPYELPASSPTRPDWGWGDDPPSSWTSITADYGWGSDRGEAFPSYLELSTREIGDDGGYAVSIRGDFPRRGASLRQRPEGFEVVLVDAALAEFKCHAGLFDQGESCTTDLKAQTLRGYSPRLAVGTYQVSVRYDGTQRNAGSLSVVRRSLHPARYHLANALPSVYATGPRVLESEPLLSGSARDETYTTLQALLGTFGQALNDFAGRGATSRLTAPLNVDDVVVNLESTFDFSSSGAAWIDGHLIRYTAKTSTTLTGVSSLPPRTIPTGARVTHVFTD